jgi:hypothetical protein
VCVQGREPRTDRWTAQCATRAVRCARRGDAWRADFKASRSVGTWGRCAASERREWPGCRGGAAQARCARGRRRVLTSNVSLCPSLNVKISKNLNRTHGRRRVLASNVSLCPSLNVKISKNLNRTPPSFEYESCRAHLGDYFL